MFRFLMGGAGLVGLLVFVAVAVFYLLTLQKTLNRCAPENRAMEPMMVWLILVPLLGLVWHFFVVINMAKSLGTEFQKRGIPEEPRPGQNLGMVMCGLACGGLIPRLGIVCSLGFLVCLILYWMKISGYSNKIAGPASTPIQPGV